MRKIIVLILAFLVLTNLIWAGGGQEQEKIKLLLVNNGLHPFLYGYDTGGYASYPEKMVADFMKLNPNVEVTIIVRDQRTGSLTVDALMAKGTPPDVWFDAAGYFTKYLVPEYAIPLEKYMDTSIYQKDLVDLYTRNGHVYALPVMNVVAAMAINKDILKQIGYVMPMQKDWTTDEFIRLSERLKAVGIPSTIIMTKDGMITWNMAWLYAFGAELYKNFDRSKITINSPETVKGLEYMKMLVDKGYAYPYPNELNDDMGVDLFTTGKVFSCMLQNGHVDDVMPEQVKQGRLAKAFEYDFVEFPHESGRAHTPVYGYQSIVVGHKSDNEMKNKAIVELIKVQAGKGFQEYTSVGGGGFPTIFGAEVPQKGSFSRSSTRALAGLSSTAGMMDLGRLEPRAREIERGWILPTQEFMAGKITAQQLLDRFEAEAIKILATK